MTGVQLAAHSTTGAWEMLYGEFVQFPDSIIPYQYYSASNVSVVAYSVIFLFLY